MIKYSKYIIAFLCLAIVIIRIIFPKLNFDLISLALVTIATFAILIEKPESIFSNTKRIKLGSFELELQELNKESKRIEENITKNKKVEKGLSGPARQNTENNNKEFSIQIIKISSEIEGKLRQIYQNKFILTSDKIIPVSKIIEELRRENYIDYGTFNLIREFWEKRDFVVHNYKFKLDERDFKIFNNIGERIIKILEITVDSSDAGLPHYGIN